MNLNFNTRINGEDFYGLLCALGATPQRDGNEFYIATGDYTDALLDLQGWANGAPMAQEWKQAIDQAVAKTGKPVDVLITWLEAAYTIHERNCVWMKFSIN